MNKANKKHLIFTIISIGLMFFWIFLTVFLTGGRDIVDFTETDRTVFSLFIFAEILTLTVLIIYLIDMQKKNKNNKNNKQNTVKTPPDKRRILITVVSFILLLSTMIAGILTRQFFGEPLHNLVATITLISLLLPILLLVTSVILNHIYSKKLNSKSIKESQQFWLSHRENPEETAAKKLSVLKTLVRINDLYSILLGVCAFVSAYFIGVFNDNSASVTPIFISFIMLCGATSRIRLKTPNSYFTDDKTYVPESEYPALYSLAKKAAQETGCSGSIKIALLDDFNAGAANIGNNISIQLGVLLLNSLCEDEVYCVLLHEFAHIKVESKRKLISDYYYFICGVHNGTISSSFSWITAHFFNFWDSLYNMQYQLYLYSATLLRENEADKTMTQFSKPEIAASSLVKINYYELYDWQKGTYDTPCSMEPEKYDNNTLKNEVDSFKEATKSNSHIWNSLIDNEILSRGATHPTLKMRLKNIGINEINVLDLESSEGYKKDCEKAIGYVSSLIEEQIKDVYDERRKYFYTESKELVEKWENDGRHIIAEEYSDICNALRRMGRNREALELCERAIDILDDAASCYAYFMKGCFLLHSFDESGIEYIYKSIENNHNYITEGLEVIGRFCCLTGQEDQLEIYRERAITLTEKNDSLYAECSVLNKKDNLSSENLPSGMLPNILEHITSEHKDNIEKIYLVRKTISNDFFTSAFVIKMSSDTDDDTRYDILHKAFNYLDTCSDWQFSLFDYADVANVNIEKIDGSCVYTK